MRGKVVLSGVDTASLPVLTHQEMQALIPLVRRGDRAARESVINGNLRLVLSVIQRFSGRAECMDDLFQVGVIGLMKAIDNFDLSHGVRFSTYAVPMIAGEIRRYLRDNSAIRISRSLRDTAYRALKAREELAGETGREPTVTEIADKLCLTPAEVSFALDAISDPVSLSDPAYRDSGDEVSVMDQVQDEKVRESSWVNDMAIQEAMEHLGQREKRIIDMRFFRGRTQMEVAKEIGISQAQVSRLEKQALKAMRKFM